MGIICRKVGGDALGDAITVSLPYSCLSVLHSGPVGLFLAYVVVLAYLLVSCLPFRPVPCR